MTSDVNPNQRYYVFIAHGDVVMQTQESSRVVGQNVSRSVDLRVSETEFVLRDAASYRLRNARVLAISSQQISVSALAQGIQEQGVKYFVMKADLDDPADVARVHAEAIKVLELSTLTAKLPRFPVFQKLGTAVKSFVAG